VWGKKRRPVISRIILPPKPPPPSLGVSTHEQKHSLYIHISSLSLSSSSCSLSLTESFRVISHESGTALLFFFFLFGRTGKGRDGTGRTLRSIDRAEPNPSTSPAVRPFPTHRPNKCRRVPEKNSKWNSLGWLTTEEGGRAVARETRNKDGITLRPDLSAVLKSCVEKDPTLYQTKRKRNNPEKRAIRKGKKKTTHYQKKDHTLFSLSLSLSLSPFCQTNAIVSSRPRKKESFFAKCSLLDGGFSRFSCRAVFLCIVEHARHHALRTEKGGWESYVCTMDGDIFGRAYLLLFGKYQIKRDAVRPSCTGQGAKLPRSEDLDTLTSLPLSLPPIAREKERCISQKAHPRSLHEQASSRRASDAPTRIKRCVSTGTQSGWLAHRTP